ncbi:Hvo_1808 family surface protein [Natronobacterium gregoryi]|uniref:Uncharacterized protein n=2 Tax=Natronobacterium gregoryi TaxID=44930 RepID=L0AGF8_NATGS|nr:Hvo_1808 family surface protein [Natronobacterium gregoryi]AFZ72504.1 hypothetical protein Natgr_1282 [Natronobacterium gregoryi SP2]ELY74375.1 hypothetical protein C490_00370 [Natronobacterium gregoryi SP2]PLK21473.1 hypothetical protein CYV19_04030 [Natronobacterium gregoryi SP2]SFI76940.1 hypothetical protein SAMN05443661_10560 [Natronobacterium gregoryi]
MKPTRTQLLVALLAATTIGLLAVVAAGVVPFSLTEASPLEIDERSDDPSTTDTVGYVEGYWYDDELPVDDRNDAVLGDNELEAVAYRSMARVETIRGLTFEEEVSVEVIDREEFNEREDVFVDFSADEELHTSVTYEALFMVDRETPATEEVESLYGGTVDGYYEPGKDEIVLVSDTPTRPELDEVVLGHELLHALQDQHFDLASYDRETIDQDNAKNGLIEGDAVWVDQAYEQQCGEEWDCVLPAGGLSSGGEPNWGLYLTIFQPYNDGPDYVDHLQSQGGWDAVDAAYDDPPATSSEVIRPGDDRDPDATIPDRSRNEWEQFEIDGDVASETVGEAGMVAMFVSGNFDHQPAVVDRDEFLTEDAGYDYDQPYTDGWDGDELVTYVDGTASANATDDALEHSAYVWQTEWTSRENAAEFVDGYLQLLEGHDAESVEDRQDTYVVDDGYPGAYYLDRSDDGDAVTIVRAPSVDDLGDVHIGAAPEGEDELEIGMAEMAGGVVDAILGGGGPVIGSMGPEWQPVREPISG